MRSTKCSTKFTTENKKGQLQNVITEYSEVVNFFVDHFWLNPHQMDKAKLTKHIVDLPKETWLTARLRKVAAREAIDMIKSVNEASKENIKLMQENIDDLTRFVNKNKEKMTLKVHKAHKRVQSLKSRITNFKIHKPKHNGKRMCISSTIGTLSTPKISDHFDLWLELRSIGNKVSIDIPIKKHKQYNKLENKGKRLNSYIITKDYIQFCFEIDPGEKLETKNVIGIDTGIKALASLSTGVQFGTDIENFINKVKGCKKGSKGKKQAIRALKQRIDEVAQEVLKYCKVNEVEVIVVEKLKNLVKNSKLKGRLSKNMRSSIGKWNYRYWLMRLELGCEANRIRFTAVHPAHTSDSCSACGFSDSRNRFGEMFTCLRCSHTNNADINAGVNIAKRFLTGPYGAGYKLLNVKIYQV